MMHPRLRKFWGWGYADERVSEAEAEAARSVYRARFGELPTPLTVPSAEEIALPLARVRPPDSLKRFVTDAHAERVSHAYGQSYADLARAFMREFPHPPDLVAYPESDGDVEAALDWANGANVAVIPFGGGTSVCGGVEPDVGDGYAGALSLDMSRMNRVLEIDRASRAALVEAGARGPEFDGELKKHGLTLRHFPQSYMMATLGGMIVTRSGGHFATLFTHIDEFVESVNLVTPNGKIETRRLPGSGAGPSPERLVSGSEGIFGVLTRAWMRVQDAPVHRASTSVRFADTLQAAEAVRVIAQSGLNPANCRLLDKAEALNNRVDDGSHAVLVLGFESADHPQDAKLARALEIAGDFGGEFKAPAQSGAKRDSAAEAWRNAFLRMPYFREVLIPHGVIADTFETACTWSAFPEFYAGVLEEMSRAIKNITGRDGTISCRFTHVYPDGPAPYFSYSCMSTPDSMLGHWKEIKLASNECVIRRGGTATHHHAVGRDHRPGCYDAEVSPLFAEALRGAKAKLDPNGIMNPGVLIDTEGNRGGPSGVFRG